LFGYVVCHGDAPSCPYAILTGRDLPTEFIKARKGWLERLLEAVRRR
jgi:hypothetical protein